MGRNWCDDEYGDGDDWNVYLWDEAGQEALVNLRQSAYPGTEVLLIGFDTTKGVSLENLQSWVDEVKEVEANIGATIVVGTKSDYYEELQAGGRGSDGQPLKTLEQMYAMAAQIGAHAFVCTSAKNGYGTLEYGEEGPAAGAEGDTMSGQGEQYLDMLIMRCGKAVKTGSVIPVLEHRSCPSAPTAAAPAAAPPPPAPAEAGELGGAPMSEWV